VWISSSQRGEFRVFIDYLTVMMVAVVAGCALAILYGLRLRERPAVELRSWSWAFGVVGVLLAVPGLHIVLTWPLPGAYNIVMGEPALFFGVLLVGAALALRAGEGLMPLALVAVFGGLINVFLAGAILLHGLSRSPLMWAVGYAAIGLGAVLAPLVVSKAASLGWARWAAGALLAVGALIFALGGFGAYIEHTSEEGFGGWQPMTLREAPPPEE
jgi:putative membrane protein